MGFLHPDSIDIAHCWGKRISSSSITELGDPEKKSVYYWMNHMKQKNSSWPVVLVANCR